MITKEQFIRIHDQINIELRDCIESILTKNPEGFLFLLANGEYMSSINRSDLNPHVVDYALDQMKDNTRNKFLEQFLNTYYTFPSCQEKIEDDFYRINLELMIYTHIWESTWILKILYRIAYLLSEGVYKWAVPLPEHGKGKFIEEDIRDIIINVCPKLGNHIKDSYNRELRNAFAHSDFSINCESRLIKLHNTKTTRELTLNEWSIIFVSTFLLAYFLNNKFFDLRRNIVTIFDRNEFPVELPRRSGDFVKVVLVYDIDNDRFHFKHNINK